MIPPEAEPKVWPGVWWRAAGHTWIVSNRAGWCRATILLWDYSASTNYQQTMFTHSAAPVGKSKGKKKNSFESMVPIYSSVRRWELSWKKWINESQWEWFGYMKQDVSIRLVVLSVLSHVLMYHMTHHTSAYSSSSGSDGHAPTCLASRIVNSVTSYSLYITRSVLFSYIHRKQTGGGEEKAKSWAEYTRGSQLELCQQTAEIERQPQKETFQTHRMNVIKQPRHCYLPGAWAPSSINMEIITTMAPADWKFNHNRNCGKYFTTFFLLRNCCLLSLLGFLLLRRDTTTMATLRNWTVHWGWPTVSVV